MHYHIWFLTKYKKAILEGDIERKLKEYFLEIARRKGYNILTLETNRDHVHMLLEAENRKTLDGMMRVIKCVSAKKILENTPHLRAGNIRHFWARSFGHKQVYEPQLEKVADYIRDQKKIPHS
ncbi:MAG: IS200/IS605 family transposase [Candidatus Omnitrophota bacterium]|nr:IS200/IS605 family transposase [Candidatus Omnitrophota bacterium]